jgi:hypothetical protein
MHGNHCFFYTGKEDAGRPLIVHEIWSQCTSFMTKDEMSQDAAPPLPGMI